MAGYEEIFARYYDRLTADVDYPAKASYLMDLARSFGKRPGLVLDLACGTGSLAAALSELGCDVIGADASEMMLCQAMQKNAGLRLPVLYLCQSMEELDLYGTVEIAFCTMDSLNHLPDMAAIGRTLERLRLFVEPGGLFIFDMNTPYKHENVLAGNAFVQELDGLFCVWQNSIAPDGALDIQMDFFAGDEKNGYERTGENIREMAYPRSAVKSELEAHGFELLAEYGDYNLLPPSADEQRIVYVSRRV